MSRIDLNHTGKQPGRKELLSIMHGPSLVLCTALSLCLCLGITPARAETPIVIERDSLGLQLRDLGYKLGRLHAQAATLTPAQLASELERLEVQLQLLTQLLDSAAPLGSSMVHFPPPLAAAPPSPAPAPPSAAPASPLAPAPTPTPTPPKAASLPAAPPKSPPGTPIDDAGLAEAVHRIADESQDPDKIRIVRELAGKYDFTIAQVIQLMPQFSFERSRVKAVETLVPRIIDKEHLAALQETFKVPSNRKRLAKIFAPYAPR